MDEDEKTARETWEAMRRHYGAGQPVGSSWDQLTPEQREYLIDVARQMRIKGWLPTQL